jgi:3',5'-cyclic AMP phosphodiesterase CpdA
MLKIVHASDLHFGKAHDADAALAFLSAVSDLRPDVIVLSGDFTQRAKVREYEAARGYIRRLPGVPIVVTPGNHDVPLYRVLERFFAPYRNYRTYIREELDTVTRLPGATLVSLNSSEPYRAIVNGRIVPDQLAFARSAFETVPEGDLRVVVAHHHLAPAPDYEGDRPLPRGRKILEAFQRMGVDLVLGGHLHRAYIGNSLDVHAGADRDRGIVIVQSGTTTSKRGRARERAKNSFNVIDVSGATMEVTHYMYFAGADGFASFSVHTFPRWPHRWLGVEPPVAGDGASPGPRPSGRGAR